MSKLLDASARLTLALAQSAALVAVILLLAASRALSAPAAPAATSNQAGDAEKIFRQMACAAPARGPYAPPVTSAPPPAHGGHGMQTTHA
jgi:hypothetical protein